MASIIELDRDIKIFKGELIKDLFPDPSGVQPDIPVNSVVNSINYFKIKYKDIIIDSDNIVSCFNNKTDKKIYQGKDADFKLNNIVISIDNEIKIGFGIASPINKDVLVYQSSDINSDSVHIYNVNRIENIVFINSFKINRSEEILKDIFLCFEKLRYFINDLKYELRKTLNIKDTIVCIDDVESYLDRINSFIKNLDIPEMFIKQSDKLKLIF